MKGKQRLIFRVLMIIVIAVLVYWRQGEVEPLSSSANAQSDRENPSVEAKKKNGYFVLEGVRMIDHRNNDGDSFFVRVGDEEFELRIYYVDAPEKYLSDRYESQRKRVAEQARALGGISVEDAVEIGEEARDHTLALLEGKEFTVYTKWEPVYDGERYYGFVKLPGGEFYLSEHLVAAGLARIHTKGETMPDGRSFFEYKDHLQDIERKAKAAGQGAWGLE